MTLGDRQRQFTRHVGLLIGYAYGQGYELTVGDAFRTEEQQRAYVKAGKSKTMNSKHILRLAIDLNLFKNGVYLTKSEDYEPLGKFWESLSPNNVWGGRWVSISDGNHFEAKDS